jgi:hypothetical protein
MYYFLKKSCDICKTTKSSRSDQPSQSFSKYTEFLNFLEFVYPDKTELLLDILKIDSSFVPDIAASVLKGLSVNNYLSTELLQKGLNCCRDILLHMTYKETHIDTIRKIIASDKDVLIVIPGCQTGDILRSRAEHAAELFKKLHTPARFVPVGKNPNRRTVDILDESARIKTVLERKLDSNLEIIPLELEQESLRTIHNIQNLFSKNFIDKSRSTSIFIVSSTFHLIRLAGAINQYAHMLKNYPNLKHFIFVGSEDKVNKVVRDKSQCH